MKGRRLSLAFILIVMALSILAFESAASEPGPASQGDVAPLGGGLVMLLLGRHIAGPEPIFAGSSMLLGALQASAGGDLPGFGRNVIVTRDASLPYENEPSIAVNPLDSANAVLAAHHTGVGDRFVMIGVYRTIDGGRSWEGPFFLPVSLDSDFGESDPAVAASPSGAFYVAYLSVGPRTVNGARLWQSSDIMLAVSRDGGETWEAFKVMGPEYLDFQELANQGIYVFGVLLDKEYIAVGADPETGEDLVVITYSEFLDGYDTNKGERVQTVRIMAVVSRDGGETWQGPFQVSEKLNLLSDPIRVVQGSNPAIAPDGTIYVAFYYSGEDGWLEGGAEILVYRSRDYGQTWEGPFVAAELPGEFPYRHPQARFRFWSSMFPSMDVAPDGTIYIVYAADPDGPGGDPGDVFLVYSTDGGETWSEPIRVNDDEPGNLQFFPWLDVDSDGLVHIIWGDTRNDPQGIAFDVYYARYTPWEGLSFNVRVSDYTNNPLFGFNFQGDYFNVAAEGGRIYAAWTDNRGGFREMGGLLWRGADQSVVVAVSGEPFTPSVSLEGYLAPRASAAVTVKGEELPARAAFTILIDGAPVKVGSFNLPLFSGDDGVLEAYILMPPLSPGEHEIAIANFFTGEPVAVVKVNVEDDISIAVEDAVRGIVSQSIAGLADSIQALDEKLASISGGLETLRGDIAAVAAGLEDAMRSLDEVKEGLARIEENQALVARKVDAIAQRQGELDRGLAEVDSKVDGVSDRLSALEERVAALEERINEAQGAASDAGTWAKASSGIALLAALGVAFLAYIVIRHS